jgi:hypothetical protein
LLNVALPPAISPPPIVDNVPPETVTPFVRKTPEKLDLRHRIKSFHVAIVDFVYDLL